MLSQLWLMPNNSPYKRRYERSETLINGRKRIEHNNPVNPLVMAGVGSPPNLLSESTGPTNQPLQSRKLRFTFEQFPSQFSPISLSHNANMAKNSIVGE